MLTAKTPLRLLLVLGLLLGVAACGDDDGSETASASGSGSASGAGSGSGSGPEEPAQGDVDEFCTSLETFNAAIFDTQIEDDATAEDIAAAHEKLDPLWADVE